LTPSFKAAIMWAERETRQQLIESVQAK